jgi:adenylate cyclase
VLAVLLIVTAGSIGWLGYSSGRQQTKRAAEDEFAIANDAATREITTFLNDPVNRLLDEFSVRARRGMLNLKDDRALGFDLAERLRVNKTLAWIHYSDVATGHFIGVYHNADGDVVFNTSTPGQGPPRQEIITPDGRELPYHPPTTDDYDPRQRDWFKNALLATGTVWSDPYQFTEGAPGITASRAWKTSDSAAPVGVFGVDFFLRDVQALLDTIAAKFQGVTLIMGIDGKLICSSTQGDAKPLAAALQLWVQAHPAFKDINGQLTNHLVPVDVAGTPYLAALDHVEAPSGLKCIVAGMVPQSVLFRDVNRAGQRMEVVGFSGLFLSLIIGVFLAHRISKPLRALGNDLAKVGDFQLAPLHMARSLVSEVNQLRDASDRMKSGLRSFIKYVPDDLVRRLLSSGNEAALGGEIRRLTVFLSDIESFATHSELVPPGVLVRELAVYFEILSRRVRQHSGTIDKFIGDGLLAFFNAPQDVPHHENLACRAALIGLQELKMRAVEGGMAAFRTRIGLHCGDVLVGNIGTPERFAYTVLGDVVNVTSRLENLNKMYGTTILASGDVRQSAGDDFAWRHLDRVAVAGRKGVMDIYELMGLQDVVADDRLKHRDHYEKALHLYFAGSFWDARREFALVAELAPADKAALLMMTRCEHMLAEDTPAVWNGVFIYKAK